MPPSASACAWWGSAGTATPPPSGSRAPGRLAERRARGRAPEREGEQLATRGGEDLRLRAVADDRLEHVPRSVGGDEPPRAGSQRSASPEALEPHRQRGVQEGLAPRREPEIE